MGKMLKHALTKRDGAARWSALRIMISVTMLQVYYAMTSFATILIFRSAVQAKDTA
jgi:hypothetical protein